MSSNAGYILDVASDAVTLLTAERAKQPLTAATTRALAGEVQTTENTTFDLGQVLQLDSATGEWLDRFGAIVGELRGGLADAGYRRFIQARIQINRSQGEHERLIRIAQLMTGASYIQVSPAYPAGYTMLIVTPSPLSATIKARVRERMEQATAAAVGVDLVNGGPVIDDVFRLDISPMPAAGDPGDGMPAAF
jgi:hypothetical protein